MVTLRNIQDLKVMSLSAALFPGRKMEVQCNSQNYFYVCPLSM